MPSSSSSAALLMDRLVSASSSDDVRESLMSMLEKLKLGDDALLPEDVWADAELLEAMLQLLSSASYKALPVEEGPVLVAQIYLLLLQDRQASILLKQPQPGRLLETLLDCIGDHNQTSYSRVLCLQVLTKVCNSSPSLAQAQLLQVPNGLHRLSEVLQDADASVRNEALLVGRIIATWPSCAKVWVFAEVCDTVISLAVDEGGLTGAPAVVADCIELLRNLLRHDVALSDLVWQSPIFAPKISQLLDLRKGREWLEPKVTISTTDDLDEILQSGTEKEAIVIPKLTNKEEDLLTHVLGLVESLLASENIRISVWKKYIPLSSLIWELALISPPPQGVKYVCAMPSASLQQLALEHVAEVWNSVDSMDRHNGLDRLLFIVCTGGAPESFSDKLGLSQAALHVLRKTLPQDRAMEIVMHSLAPPMSQDSLLEQPPTCVQKLLNTVMENVSSGTQNLERRKINLSGSLGALGAFMNDSTSREMILKITFHHSLIDHILESLESQDETIQLSLLRFLCEWVMDTPTVVQSIFSSTQSTCLSLLISKPGKTATMTGLLLGMCMEYMVDDPEKNGGWTRESILSIVQNGKGSVSGFLSRLESFKKEELLWRASPSEWKGFVQWYSTQVLIVRRRLVHELTGSGGGDNDNDASDEGDAVVFSTKSLQKLLLQQSNELDEMRSILDDAHAKISNQEKQMQLWQRRIESTPNQLDEILSELSLKNQELEATVSELQRDMQSSNDAFLTQLKAKEDETADLQNQLDAAIAREQDALAEHEALRGEMEGISSAYTTLENEFNRSRDTLPIMASESQQDGRQPEGEVSSQENSSEFDSVRAENARLRADARAADDWMQMAVQRMNDIGGQNVSLQHELAILKEQLSQVSESTYSSIQEQLEQEQLQKQALEAKLASEMDTVQQELEQERNRRQSLETQLASVNAGESTADAALQQELGVEKMKRLSLESQLTNAQQDVTDVMENLQKMKAEKEELARKVENMDMDLTIATADATSLREAHRQLEIKLQAALVEGEMPSLDPPSTEEIDSLRSTVESLQEQLTDAQAELKTVLLRERSEIDSRDEIILELKERESMEQPLPSIMTPSGDSTVKARDNEIVQLRLANEAAQEWMSKAVEHHTMLSEQVTSLSDERDALKRELREVRNTMSTMKKKREVEVSMEDHIQMETDLAEKTAELQDAELELDELKAKLLFAEDELSAQRSICQLNQSSSDEVRDFKTKLLERDQQIQLLQAEIEKGEKGDFSKDAVANLKNELAEMVELTSQLTKKASLFESVQRDLQDSMDRVLVLESEVSQLSEDKATAQMLLDGARDDLQNKEREISNRMAEVEATKQATSNELSNLKAALSQREHDVFQLRNDVAKHECAVEDIELLKNELISATDDNIRLKAELDSLKSGAVSVNDRTESFEQVQTELQNLMNSKSALEQSCEASMVALERMRSDLISLKQDNEFLSVKVDTRTTEIENLKAHISDLETASSNSQQIVAELEAFQVSSIVQAQRREDEISSLSVKVETFETENNLLSELTKSLEDEKKLLAKQLQDFSDGGKVDNVDLSKMKDKVSIMEMELATVQSENREIVEQWEVRVLELEAGTKELEGELEKQQKEASDVIEQWSTRCLDLEQRVSDLQSNAAKWRLEKVDLQTKLDEARQDGIGLVESLQSKLQLRDDEIVSLGDKYKADTEILKVQLEEMNKKVNDYEWKVESYTQESTHLAKKLAESEQCLVLSSDTLQNRINELNSQLQAERDQGIRSCDTLQMRIKELESAFEIVTSEHKSNLAKWEEERESFSDQASSLSQQNEACRIEIEKLRQLLDDKVVNNDDTLTQWETKIAELDSEASSLRYQLEQQQEEAGIVIDQWENHSSDLEVRNSTLELEVETLKDELCRARADLKSAEDEFRSQLEHVVQTNNSLLQKHVDDIATESEEVIKQWQERVSELEDVVAELERQLEKQQMEAMDAISEWQDTCSNLENENLETKKDYSALSQTLITALKFEIESKEGMLSSFLEGYERTHVDVQENSPASIMDALKFAMVETDQLIAQVVDGLVSEREAHLSAIEKLGEQIEQKDVINKTLQTELIIVKESMIDQNKHDSEIAVLQQHVEESQNELISLRALLDKEKMAVASFEKKLSVLEVTNEAKRELEIRLDNDKTLIHTFKADLDASRAKQMDLESELLRQESALADSNLALSKAIAALEKSETTLSDSRSECVDLERIVEELQGELEAANNSLPGQITDEISERATEMATQALREQLLAMQDQLEGDRERLQSEKEARKAAQEEAARLKSDLAVLLRAEDAPDRLSSLMMSAVDEIQGNERREIDELRKTLERVMQDLVTARLSEKSASEIAASSRLQATLFEQEVIDAKADIASLTDTIDEMRQTESGRIASFEYRITALEDDRETLRRFHADELENVRNELYHLSMEKDRVLQALKDSEKTNAALLYTTTREHEAVGPDSSSEAELAKLRVSHAQLLAAVSEEGSRTERRIKEAMAASAASIEADVIVERELRFAAEKALEIMRVQVENMRQPKSPRALPSNEIDRLSSQLKQAKADTKKLVVQLSTMRREYESFKAESKAAIDDLAEKYRKAQAKARKLEREGQLDSEVNLEAARLRSTHSRGCQNDDNWLVAQDSTVEEEKKDMYGHQSLMSPSAAFDYIQQQKAAIHEERQMYQELLAEHDDLLALLAQHDLEKASLHAALLDAAGSDAVEAAIQEAEVNAVKQFGRYIQLQQ